jgi:hypothetical protein
MNQGTQQGWGVSRQIAVLFVMVTVAVLFLWSTPVTFAQGRQQCAPAAGIGCPTNFECINSECVPLPCDPDPCPPGQTCGSPAVLACLLECTNAEECVRARAGNACEGGVCATLRTQTLSANSVSELIARINEANQSFTDEIIELRASTYTLMNIDNNTDGPNGLPSIRSPITSGPGSGIGGSITITLPFGATSPATIQRNPPSAR